MAIIGITGGIASGKSTFTRLVAEIRQAWTFDCDACARELLDSDPAVREAVVGRVLATAYRPDGTPDRAAIRALVFSDPEAKARLEAILHPLVRARRVALAQDARAAGRDLLVDVPLLFETNGESGFDWIATVACSPETQILRAMSRGLTLEQVQRIVDSQWSNAQKIARSDFVVWNDGAPCVLKAQAEEFAARFKTMIPELFA